MKTIEQVLKKLDSNNMHVKEFDGEMDKEVCGSINHVRLPIDTHYVMQGMQVVHIGNLTTIESFANRLAL